VGSVTNNTVASEAANPGLTPGPPTKRSNALAAHQYDPICLHNLGRSNLAEKAITSMSLDSKKLRQAGTFTISPGKDIYGELTLARAKTSLYVRDKEHFNVHGVRNLNGVLHDPTRVSLIDCITPGAGSGSRGDDRYHFANIFPHYVLYGNQHLNPLENAIVEVNFVLDDAPTLFYDFDAFGSLIDARPYIDQIAHANKLNREIKTGPMPEILYFTGKTEIFEVDTVFGKVSAAHAPSHSIGGPTGVGLRNTIFISILEEDGLIFKEAINRTLTLTRYLGLLVGRPQKIIKLAIRLKTDVEAPSILEVYWSMPPTRNKSKEIGKPHPADVLVDAIKDGESFSTILRNWLERQETWHLARFGFFNSFSEQRNYGMARLIGAANMFDILPSSAVPPNVEVTDELNSAKVTAVDLFRQLPPSPERDSLLSALGRIGKRSLKQKVRYRAQRVIDTVGDRFPELISVTDAAVNCRNYFVHGGEPQFDYDKNFDLVNFFIDTLEFVFAASDLIECGWDIKGWSKIPTSMSHPFGRYRVNYAGGLQMFKSDMPGA
jgi:ApeA N-terminal domain 1/Apea-like HEPN